MKKTLLFFVLACLCSSPTLLWAQSHDAQGMNFWVGFMDNIDSTQGDNTLSVIAVVKRDCNVCITNPNTGWSATYSLQANVPPTRLYIPLAQAFHHGVHSGQVLSKGIHVTASDTITLFSVTEGYPSMDIACILPIEMIGSNYMVQAYPTDRYPSEFVVVAAQDNVIVDITPNCNTSNGWPAHSTHSILLPHAGSSIQIQGASGMDISGSTIRAQNNKKIAVFNGDACVYIPSHNECPSCDHAVEQAVPFEQWGTQFVARGSERGNNKRDVVRITSLEDNNIVRINGAVAGSLNAGQTHTYTLGRNDEVVFVETTEQAVAYQYNPSMNSSSWAGDPSMTTLPPLQQGTKEAKFTSCLSSNSVAIITPTTNVGNIRLDGRAITPSFSPINHSNGFSIAYVQVSENPHTIVSLSDQKFIAYSMGFDTRVSYGFAVGLSSYNLTHAKLYVNEILHPDYVDICLGDTVHLKIEHDSNILQLIWHNLTNDSTYSGSTLNLPFANQGPNEVCAYINYSDGMNSWDTLCTTINVLFSPDRVINDSICQDATPYVYRGQNLYDDTVITTALSYPCPHTESLNLTVFDIAVVLLDTTVCTQMLPLDWRGIHFETADSKVVILTTTEGCDSICTYTLTTKTCVGGEDTSNIWVPNAFTPSLGANNTFRIYAQRVRTATVTIYQRWGDFVSQFDGLTQSWDGTYHGKPCPQGMYVYRIDYSTEDEPIGTQHVLFGSILLLR